MCACVFMSEARKRAIAVTSISILMRICVPVCFPVLTVALYCAILCVAAFACDNCFGLARFGLLLTFHQIRATIE